MRNCVFCTYFDLSFVDDYSEHTPGLGAYVGCSLGKWELSAFADEFKVGLFRTNVQNNAKDCKEYEEIRND